MTDLGDAVAKELDRREGVDAATHDPEVLARMMPLFESVAAEWVERIRTEWPKDREWPPKDVSVVAAFLKERGWSFGDWLDGGKRGRRDH